MEKNILVSSDISYLKLGLIEFDLKNIYILQLKNSEMP